MTDEMLVSLISTRDIQQPGQFRVKISPKKAADILELANVGNRKLRRDTVIKYAFEMVNGQWVASRSMTIDFDVNGHLVNGQHRLSAVVAADIPVEFYVNLGEPCVIRALIDTGLARGNSDTIHYDTRVSDEFREAIAKDRNRRIALMSAILYIGNIKKPSPLQLEECYFSNRKMLDWCFAQTCYKHTGMVRGATSAAKYLAAGIAYIMGYDSEIIVEWLEASVALTSEAYCKAASKSRANQKNLLETMDKLVQTCGHVTQSGLAVLVNYVIRYCLASTNKELKMRFDVNDDYKLHIFISEG